ncbi:hypothetical protein RRG08_034208 [Elysia crispata]|uniref:Uncharacterized protein n=1 Tax=Elysia crispata TaxID=231223 RepID=A0AAE1A0S5_9GAST|nr:hypothetical protein RRG08_034208 [Elysia crispata]
MRNRKKKKGKSKEGGGGVYTGPLCIERVFPRFGVKMDYFRQDLFLAKLFDLSKFRDADMISNRIAQIA